MQKNDFRHYEQTELFQKRFLKIMSLVWIQQDVGPFLGGEDELIQLDNRDVMGPSIVKTVKQIEDLHDRDCWKKKRK